MILFLDCSSGVSGDILAAALLAATSDGGPASVLKTVVWPALAAVGIDPAAAALREVRRGGFAALAFEVADGPGFATMSELVSAVSAAGLPADLTAHVVSVAKAMGAAERAVHGAQTEHLHELGGLDTAVDLITVAAVLGHLAPAEIVASPPALGGGAVMTAHGELTVPAPAVVYLLRDLPTAGGGDPAVSSAQAGDLPTSVSGSGDSVTPVGELTTPTGAALLAHFVTRFGAFPAGAMVACGAGAGARETPGRANLLRAFMIDERAADASLSALPQDALGEFFLLETNIDDASAEVLAYAAEELRAAGAADVWLTPALMKKGRAGTVVHVLARAADRDRLAALLLRETTTFGLRVLPVGRLHAEERRETVVLGNDVFGASISDANVADPADVSADSAGAAGAAKSSGDSADAEAKVAVRLGYVAGELVTVSPEFEDCKLLAVQLKQPLKRVYEAAQAVAWRRFGGA